MNIIHLFFLLFCLPNICFAADSMAINIDQKSHEITTYEMWWDYSLGNTVSMDTFAGWLGDADTPSRVAMRNHIRTKNYESILDVPCGLCVDFVGIKKERINIRYFGLDTSKKLVVRAKSLGVNVIDGSIEEIPYPSSQFDISYGRHILEHLPYYETAINELIRVAKKEVLIVFFLKPASGDILDCQNTDNYQLYHNIYDRQKLQKFITSNKKVSSIAWEQVNQKEEILHIYLNE